MGTAATNFWADERGPANFRLFEFRHAARGLPPNPAGRQQPMLEKHIRQTNDLHNGNFQNVIEVFQ